MFLGTVRGLPGCFIGDSNICGCWSFLLRWFSFSSDFFNSSVGIRSLVSCILELVGKGARGLIIPDVDFFFIYVFSGAFLIPILFHTWCSPHLQPHSSASLEIILSVSCGCLGICKLHRLLNNCPVFRSHLSPLLVVPPVPLLPEFFQNLMG